MDLDLHDSRQRATRLGAWVSFLRHGATMCILDVNCSILGITSVVALLDD